MDYKDFKKPNKRLDAVYAGIQSAIKNGNDAFEVEGRLMTIEDAEALQWQLLSEIDVAFERLNNRFSLIYKSVAEAEEENQDFVEFEGNIMKIADALQIKDKLYNDIWVFTDIDVTAELLRGAKNMNKNEKGEANNASKKSDTPTRLSSVTAQDMAREISATIRDLTSVEVSASVNAVNYSGSLGSRGPFKRPGKISFELSTVMEGENAEKAIAQLQSVSAQQMADSVAARLTKIAGEAYDASPDQMRFSSRKGKVTGMFSIFVALSGDTYMKKG